MVIFDRKDKISILAMGGLMAITASGYGQTAGMLQDERAVTACSPGYEDYRNGTGVIYGGATPSSTPINFSYSYTGGDSDVASVSQTVHGNFGQLSEATTGSAHGGAGNGAFTWSSTFWGGDVVVGFYDYITANQDMDISFKYTVTGQSSFQANADGGTQANVTTSYDFSALGGGGDFALNGSQLYSGSVHLFAGEQVALFAGLGWDCAANAADGNTNPASYQMSATGIVQLQVLTQGATFTSLSGYQYAAVPEPSPLWALGLGALGLLRRKRR